MGVRGRSLLKDYTLEQIQDAFIEKYGRVKEVAIKLHCCDNALYDLLDIYPELQEVRLKASKRYRQRKVETSEEVLEKIMEKVHEDPTNAGKQAQFILKNNKESPYYDDSKDEKIDETHALREVAQIIKDSQ